MIFIYSNTISRRLEYTCKFIFSEFLGVPFQIVTDRTFQPKENQILINYSPEAINSSVRIIPSGLLQEKNISKQTPAVKSINQTPILFPDENSQNSFDIFSAVFYMLSRYEEYQDFIPDQHGRFPAKESLAYKNNFLALPVVDMWILDLANELQKINPSIKFKERTFSLHSTIDIDNAYAYKGKTGVRMYGSMVKSLMKGRTNDLKARRDVLSGKKGDPFDGYDFQLMLSEKMKVPLTYFVLFTEKGKFDVSLSPENPEMLKLVRKLSERAEIGIHPSYQSSEQKGKLPLEIAALSSAIKKTISKSRQHFLKFRFPETPRYLLENSITEDYSMGFSTHNGFRAGTATPFYLYDLGREEESRLKFHPFHIMDSVFYDQQKIPAEKAMNEILMIAEEVMKVKGSLISVWHDRSFDETTYSSWKNNYIKLHEFCTGVKLS